MIYLIIRKYQYKDTEPNYRVEKWAKTIKEANQHSINKVMQVISLMDGNLKELAIKLMELEKKLEAYEPRKN